ncbi:glutathione S-transferase family protein [Acetobacteraceae bacterium KSS8]|uniref:Glutathione S-transferase family protein n=1 Tax=Endosaccharibacter trunci TaxID=2812733 RepID=A0ABT1W5P3_9PROT|nr:glutathione S-transferase family protein [Acetobacteraceae bacterium KSS8]
MRLIGMPDSPFVRRVAISLHRLAMPFEHEKLSVFRDYDRFRVVNPSVKAPTLVLEDGTVLFESGLILDYLERIAPAGRSLMPANPALLPKALRSIALGLAVCEKSVQISYETNLRPAEKRHEPWLDRLRQQLDSSLAMLEQTMSDAEPWLFGQTQLQPDITLAVAWWFANHVAPDSADPARFPALAAHSARAEATEAFRLVPPA